jgi:hypothetical protein
MRTEKNLKEVQVEKFSKLGTGTINRQYFDFLLDTYHQTDDDIKPLLDIFLSATFEENALSLDAIQQVFGSQMTQYVEVVNELSLTNFIGKTTSEVTSLLYQSLNNIYRIGQTDEMIYKLTGYLKVVELAELFQIQNESGTRFDTLSNSEVKKVIVHSFFVSSFVVMYGKSSEDNVFNILRKTLAPLIATTHVQNNDCFCTFYAERLIFFYPYGETLLEKTYQSVEDIAHIIDEYRRSDTPFEELLFVESILPKNKGFEVRILAASGIPGTDYHLFYLSDGRTKPRRIENHFSLVS